MYVPMWLGRYFQSESGVFNSTVMSLPSTVTDSTFSNSARLLGGDIGVALQVDPENDALRVTGPPSEN